MAHANHCIIETTEEDRAHARLKATSALLRWASSSYVALSLSFDFSSNTTETGKTSAFAAKHWCIALLQV